MAKTSVSCTDVCETAKRKTPTVLIQIEVTELWPPRGTVGIDGRQTEFAGWMQLLGFLSDVLEREPPTKTHGCTFGELDSGGQA
jgi:hypothetical protein